MSNYTSVHHLTKDKKKKPAPVSVGGVERGEYPTRQEAKTFEIHEVVEHEPDKEVDQHIEVKKDKIKIPKEAKQVGAIDTGSTNFPAYNPIKLPISDKQVFVDLHKPITSSARWLGELCKLILKQAHLGLKKVHGKIVRVIQ